MLLAIRAVRDPDPSLRIEMGNVGLKGVEMIRLVIPEIDDEEIKVVKEVLDSGWLVQGERVKQFEELVAAYVGTRYAVAVNSGTSALHLSLLSLGITNGDEVITSDFTFPATANVIELVGARPVFVDIDPDTYNLDVNQIEGKISERTKAIMPVHLFGQVTDIKPILELARKYNLKIIEDAAPALGATCEVDGKTRQAGSFGDLGCFSFHPRKVITTGEGGIIATDNLELDSILRSLRNHGIERNIEVTDFVLAGLNNRMTEMQAAIGIIQMRKLDRMISRRQLLARLYDELLSGIPWLKTPQTLGGANHTYQAYVILLDNRIDRNNLMSRLSEARIETTIGTYAMHQTRYYSNKYSFEADDFPSARIAFEQSLALPLYPRMSEGDVRLVVNSLKKAKLC